MFKQTWWYAPLLFLFAFMLMVIAVVTNSFEFLVIAVTLLLKFANAVFGPRHNIKAAIDTDNYDKAKFWVDYISYPEFKHLIPKANEKERTRIMVLLFEKMKNYTRMKYVSDFFFVDGYICGDTFRIDHQINGGIDENMEHILYVLMRETRQSNLAEMFLDLGGNLSLYHALDFNLEIIKRVVYCRNQTVQRDHIECAKAANCSEEIIAFLEEKCRAAEHQPVSFTTFRKSGRTCVEVKETPRDRLRAFKETADACKDITIDDVIDEEFDLIELAVKNGARVTEKHVQYAEEKCSAKVYLYLSDIWKNTPPQFEPLG